MNNLDQEIAKAKKILEISFRKLDNAIEESIKLRKWMEFILTQKPGENRDEKKSQSTKH
jgi:hypothetical protein